MKLEKLTVGEKLPVLLAETLQRLGAEERASYKLLGDEDPVPRILMATDRGLADVRLSYSNQARGVEITCAVQPWHRVTPSVVVTVEAGPQDRADGGTILVSDVTIEREWRRGEEFDDFAAALLELGRGES